VTVAPDGAVVADGGDAPAEVVIDENYYRRWVDQNGGRRDGATAGRAGRGDPGRGPLPPVVPDSDRLSVAPMPATAPPGTPVPPAEAPEAVRASAPQGDVSPLAMYRAALDAFNQGQYDEAARGLQGFIAAGPDADYMDNAYFWLGECAYGEGKYEEALSQFQKVVREYPDGNKVPDALLKVALSYERLNNVDGAKTVLGQLVSTYPSTDSARRAAERLRALQ
jgi:tol-pal system protein YbgF